MSDSNLLSILLQELQETFRHDLLRYVLGAGGTYMVVNICLRPVLQKRRIQTNDINARQICREILVSLRTVIIFSMFGTSIGMMARLGWNQIYTEFESHGQIWFWTSIVLIVVAHDAWFYWSHRLLHHPRLFRRWHALHHKSRTPTPFTSYSFDWEEAVINALFLLIWTVFVPMYPSALFVFVVHMMLRNAIGHCGYEVFPACRDGRPLFGWLTTVTHHDLHHSHGRWNMGLYFTWWDRAMGTEHPDYLNKFKIVKGHSSTKSLIAVMGSIAITLAAMTPQPAQAELVKGTYVTAGLGIVLSIADCPERASQTCIHVKSGIQALPRNPMETSHDPMWRMTKLGPFGWIRDNGMIQQIQACQGRCWRRLYQIHPELRRMSVRF